MLINNLKNVPSLKPTYTFSTLDQEVTIVLNEQQRKILTSENTALILEEIDGKNSIEHILATLEGKISDIEVLSTLNNLYTKGYLETKNEGQKNQYHYFDEGLGIKVETQLSISLKTTFDETPATLTKALQDSGINATSDGDITVVIADDHLNPELIQLDKELSQQNTPWILVKAAGLKPTIGPIFNNTTDTCFHCFRFWVSHNRPVEKLIARNMGTEHFHLPAASSNTSEAIVYNMLAIELKKLIHAPQHYNYLSTNLVELNLQTLEFKQHAALHRPQCPYCGDAQLMSKQAYTPITLKPIQDLHNEDGGYRKRPPAETYEKYKHLISPITGPINYLVPMPGRHCQQRNVFASGYLVTPQEIPRTNTFDKLCAGKGWTVDQARTSALCEALERFSGVYQGDEATIRGSISSLKENAIHFNALQNYSEHQFANRGAINKLTDDKRKQVPLPFDKETIIDWTPAWSLNNGEKHYIPLPYCFAETPRHSGTEYGIHNPNGVAAGTCLEEAVLQGILELVERDATAIWWYNQIERPEIDLRSFNDPYLESLIDHYTEMGWKLWVLDLTHDLNIPVCTALAENPQEKRFAIGFGCHLNAHLAVQRALTEVNQLFDPSGHTPSPWDVSKISNDSFLYPDSNTAPNSAQELLHIGGKDLKADIDYCIKQFSQQGMQTLAVNKTRPDIGLDVAQVIVPGLRHFWPRFGSGRLYTVPVALGWLKYAKQESELNKAALFL